MDCKDDFAIFELSQNIDAEDFPWEVLFAKDFEILEAPEGLEKRVMTQIHALEDCPQKSTLYSGVKLHKFLENLIYISWCSVYVLLGTGFMLAINEERITSFFYNVPALEHYGEFVGQAAQFVDNRVLNLVSFFEFILNQALLFLSGYRYLFLIILIVLVTIQLFIYKTQILCLIDLDFKWSKKRD